MLGRRQRHAKATTGSSVPGKPIVWIAVLVGFAATLAVIGSQLPARARADDRGLGWSRRN